MTKALFSPAISITFEADPAYHEHSKLIRVAMGTENDKKEIRVFKVQMIKKDNNRILGRQSPTLTQVDLDNVKIAIDSLITYFNNHPDMYDKQNGFNGYGKRLPLPAKIKTF